MVVGSTRDSSKYAANIMKWRQVCNCNCNQ